MPAFVSVGIHRDPIRMRFGGVIVGRVRIGAHDDDHAEFAATSDEFAEHVAIAEPRAAMMKGNLRRIIRHATAAAQADASDFVRLK